MLIIKGVKILTFAFIMFPISFASLSVGILFSSYNIAVSRNPEESDNLFTITMIAFALIETFVFMSMAVALLVYFL